ncbi:MAG TPA: DUF4340 domain-containing protein [Steroidobacteraceae bacterium]|nr:DUF4340 domain-containing protein [Steroidobacteraceae bacterium]
MSRQRFIVLLVAALVAITAALYLSTQRNVVREVHGLPLLPALASKLDSVTSLSVLKGSTTPSVTVHKQGEQWTVAERANYPADVAKLHKLLLALSDAKIREEKTSDPANYSIIGVEDPTKPGATGAQIELLAKDAKLDVIVGKPIDQGNFVRRAGEKSSYIVEPGISFEAEPRFWIDTRLLNFSADKIQSIQFKPDTGSTYTVRRVSEPTPKPDDGKKAAPNTPGTPNAAGAPAAAAAAPAPAATPAEPAPSKFVLEGVPSGRQAADPNTLAPSPTAFSNLNDDDVAPIADIDFSKPSTVTLTLSDGSVITLTGAAVGEKRWIQIAAPQDATLSTKTSGRAFEIASYRYDQIFRPLEQLLEPKPAPAAKPAPPAAKPVPSGSSPPPSAKKPAAAPKP